MKKARYTTGIVILILLASLITWPMGQAIIPQEQTISIIDTHDDAFITESGNLIDTYLCHITDPNMDIVSFLVFRELDINFWEPLTNATLRFRTTVNLDFDADSSVTIYGMKIKNLQDEGIIRPSFVLSVPKTSAYVNVNTSQFYGQQWHEVDVTNIIQELKSSIHWDGHGRSGDETGDDVGFIIYGAEGHDTRWFIDYYYGTPDLASQLVIHWNHEFSPPSGYEDAEFVETYGDNYTIWQMPGGEGYSLDPMEYVFTNGTDSPYKIKYDDIAGSGPFLVSTTEHPGTTGFNDQRKLVRLSDGTLYVAYFKQLAGEYQIYVKQSDDNGETWTDETRISVNVAKHMENYLQEYPSIAVDPSDNLHVVWRGQDDDSTPYNWIWYTKYTDSWSTPLRISTSDLMQLHPYISVDSSGDIHVVWGGKTAIYPKYQVWHTKYTDLWSTPVRISDLATMEDYDQTASSIEIDSNDHLHVFWKGRTYTYYLYEAIWYAKYDGAWSEPLLIFQSGLGSQYYPSAAIDSSDNIHLVWDGTNPPYGPYQQIWYKKYNGSWSSEYRLSNATGMDDYGHLYPSIAVDSGDKPHVLWHGKATGYTTYNVVWYTNYTESWANPDVLQPTGQNMYTNLRWSRWPEAEPSTYIVADANGTVLVEDLESVEDAEDWIDGVDPDPEDPDPGGEWSTGPGGETGAFTRFRMRLWFMLIGFGCLFGPVLFFAWRRPSGYYIMCGAIVMLIGIGLLLSIGQV